MVTVFTPTYNRSHLLPRLYESLKQQTDYDFEWLVVDDGSTDNTSSLFDSWCMETDFSVRYVRQSNGGKHRAINKGACLAKGEYFFIVDSDDWLRPDAIEKIKKWFCEIAPDLYCGVSGLRLYPDGTIIGDTFSDKDFLDAYTYERKANRIIGDKSEVVYTKFFLQFPFPEIPGEVFCPEALVWNRMSYSGYKIRYYNEGIYYCDYQDDGLSSKIDKLLTENIKSYFIYSSELISNKKASKKERVACLCNVSRRGINAGYRIKEISRILDVSSFAIGVGYVIAMIVYFLRR